MTGPRPSPPAGARLVRERTGASPGFTVPEWEERYPWLVHGTTGEAAGDLGLFGDTPVGESLGRWRALTETLGLPRAVHARQVHGAAVLAHGEGVAGLCIAGDGDGHVTDRPGLLLTVSVADCVPISLVDPARRRVALLHAGWRGTVAGIVGAGLRTLGSNPAGLVAHLGPAICGECYEVGPEVHEALGLPRPVAPEPVDLRALQALELVRAGIPADRVTVSRHCTRCGEGFFSHRKGSRGRQMGVLGIR